ARFLETSEHDVHRGLFDAVRDLLGPARTDAAHKQTLLRMDWDAMLLLVHHNATALLPRWTRAHSRRKEASPPPLPFDEGVELRGGGGEHRVLWLDQQTTTMTTM